MKKSLLCITVIIASSLLFTSCFVSSNIKNIDSNSSSSSLISSSSNSSSTSLGQYNYTNDFRYDELHNAALLKSTELNLKPNECYFFKKYGIPVRITNPTLLTLKEFDTYYKGVDISEVPKEVAGKTLTYILPETEYTGKLLSYIYEDFNAVPEDIIFNQVSHIALSKQPITAFELVYTDTSKQAINVTISNLLEESVYRESVIVTVNDKDYTLVANFSDKKDTFHSYTHNGIKPLIISSGTVSKKDNIRKFSPTSLTQEKMTTVIKSVDIDVFKDASKLIQPYKNNGGPTTITPPYYKNSPMIQNTLPISVEQQKELFDIAEKKAKKLDLKPNEYYYFKKYNCSVLVSNPTLLTLDEFDKYYNWIDISSIPKEFADKPLKYVLPQTMHTGMSSAGVSFGSDESMNVIKYNEVLQVHPIDDRIFGINLVYADKDTNKSAIAINVSNNTMSLYPPKDTNKVVVNNNVYNLFENEYKKNSIYMVSTNCGNNAITIKSGSVSKHDNTLFFLSAPLTENEVLTFIESIDMSTFKNMPTIIKPY